MRARGDSGLKPALTLFRAVPLCCRARLDEHRLSFAKRSDEADSGPTRDLADLTTRPTAKGEDPRTHRLLATYLCLQVVHTGPGARCRTGLSTLTDDHTT